MGKKKVRLPSLFRSRETTAAAKYPWYWPYSCAHPSPNSFRAAAAAADDIFKTVNSVFFNPIAAAQCAAIETPDSWFTSASSDSASLSAESDESGEESLETIIYGARSERLFFEPGGGTSSIMEYTSAAAASKRRIPSPPPPPPPPPLLPSEESVMVAVESGDPYADFRRSMEEMVEFHGIRDWKWLEELLEWYLRMNGKQNHGIIVGAFIDLFAGLAPDSSTPSSSSFSSSSPSATSFASVVSSFPPVVFEDHQKGK